MLRRFCIHNIERDSRLQTSKLQSFSLLVFFSNANHPSSNWDFFSLMLLVAVFWGKVTSGSAVYLIAVVSSWRSQLNNCLSPAYIHADDMAFIVKMGCSLLLLLQVAKILHISLFFLVGDSENQAAITDFSGTSDGFFILFLQLSWKILFFCSFSSNSISLIKSHLFLNDSTASTKSFSPKSLPVL